MKSYLLSFIMLGCALSFTANAGVIEDRKANFKQNVSILRAIQSQIQADDYEAVAAGARKIADWAQQMPDFFPEGSESSGALDAIWMDFDDFVEKAGANKQAALNLEMAAQTEDAGKIMASVQKLSGTCKSCHQSYKAN